ncbi:MAG: hypothetical protein FWC70_04265 [Defluviitaleaceae bacterium]|nr:hypothetical protein [Defluviitaleaceae bacterium]
MKKTLFKALALTLVLVFAFSPAVIASSQYEIEAVPLGACDELISFEEAVSRGYTIISLSEILRYDEFGNPIASNRFLFGRMFSLTAQWSTVPGTGTNLMEIPLNFFIFNDEANPGNLAVEVQWTDTFSFIARNVNIPRGYGLPVTVPARTGNRAFRINLRASNAAGTFRVISMM